MAEWLKDVEDLTLKGQIKVPYTWSVGEVGSRFLVSLRDHKIIMGNKCSQCDTVFVPPRKNCGKCYQEIGDEEWREISSEGKVVSFTIVRNDSPIYPYKPPFSIAQIKLDGSDVEFTHLIEKNLELLKPGVRVKAIFAENRHGRILDIESFKII